MREWSPELLAGDAVVLGTERCRRLSALTGESPAPIWQWGFIERVSTGLYLHRLGMHAEATEILDVATRWAEHPNPF